MNAIYASLICIAGALVCAVLRQMRPELASITAIAAGIAAILVCMEDIRQAAGAMENLSQAAGLDTENTAVMLKASHFSGRFDLAADFLREKLGIET